jgi:hypothetical protein
MFEKYKAKQVVKQKAAKEAEQIFMKLNPKMAMKDGNFPKSSPEMTPEYNKEAQRITRQVLKTRVSQFKSK